jgi:hypothetical protein
MLTRPLGRSKNRWEDDIINDMKKLKIKNWIAISENYMLRRPKRSKNEVVVPKEEENYFLYTHIKVTFKLRFKFLGE